MMTERASIFDSGTDTDFDVSGFTPQKPKASPSREKVREASEGSEFRSREPVEPGPAWRKGRVHRTGRNVHINVKIRAETQQLFYRISDAQKWVLGETLERALLALERELKDA